MYLPFFPFLFQLSLTPPAFWLWESSRDIIMMSICIYFPPLKLILLIWRHKQGTEASLSHPQKAAFKAISFSPTWSCKHCWQFSPHACAIFSLSSSLMYQIWQAGSYRPPASLSPWQQGKTIHDPMPWSHVSIQLICPEPLTLMEQSNYNLPLIVKILTIYNAPGNYFIPLSWVLCKKNKK